MISSNKNIIRMWHLGQESSVVEKLTSGASVPSSIPGPAGFFVSL